MRCSGYLFLSVGDSGPIFEPILRRRALQSTIRIGTPLIDPMNRRPETIEE
jgi:hypothetical protein